MDDVIDILDRLVGFDTVSAKPNAGMVDHLESFCAERGAATTRIAGREKGKAGLVARFGPDAAGGVVLSGHCDVVPADGQDWSRPAFELGRDGDRLYGRGTTDMKGFLACMLAAGDRASRGGAGRPLTLVFSYDEETGCVGIQEMKAELGGLLGKPSLCIVGEPTGMRVATGHKGKASLRATCKGEGGHSALAPRYVNALHLATDFVAGLRGLQDRYAADGARDDAYDIPHTTLHAGRMEGGTALNIVPEAAEVLFEFRYLPADGHDAVLGEVERMAEEVAAPYRKALDGAGIAIERFAGYPGLEAGGDSEAARLALSLAPEAGPIKVDFGTEAGVFAEIGVPTVVCGPGSMAGQGHKPDEYIEIAQLAACRSMLDDVVDSLQ